MFTVDTRDPTCPIHRMYVADVVPINTVVHADHLHAAFHPVHAAWPLAVIKATEHSDYTGGTVEASNHRVLAADFAGDLLEIVGAHGYRALAYDASLGPVPAHEDLCEALAALQGCPVIDEDDLADLERARVNAAWDDFGARDFARSLESLCDRLDPDHDHAVPIDDSACPPALGSLLADAAFTLSFPDAAPPTYAAAVRLLWEIGVEALNVGDGFVHELGGGIAFPTLAWIAKARRAPIALPLAAIAVHLREAA